MTLSFLLERICAISNVSHDCLYFTTTGMNLQQFLSSTESMCDMSRITYLFCSTKPCTSMSHPVWVNVTEMNPLCSYCTVRVEVLCFWLWTLHCWSGTKSSGLFHSAWASGSSEQSGWQRTRHQHWYYKGLKTDRAPEALASLLPWILHNKVHNTQYPHLSCPAFMIPVRGPDGFIGIIKCPPENWISIKGYGKEF